MIKRSWDFNNTLLKRKEKVSGEMAINLKVYNLRRSMPVYAKLPKPKARWLDVSTSWHIIPAGCADKHKTDFIDNPLA